MPSTGSPRRRGGGWRCSRRSPSGRGSPSRWCSPAGSPRRSSCLPARSAAWPAATSAPGSDLRGGGEVKELADSVNAMAERLKTQFDALEAGARELDTLFDAVQAGIAVLDADGRVERFNPSFPRLTGTPDPAGRSVWEVTHEPGLVEAARTCRERGAPVAMEVARSGACCWRASRRWSGDRCSFFKMSRTPGGLRTPSGSLSPTCRTSYAPRSRRSRGSWRCSRGR